MSPHAASAATCSRTSPCNASTPITGTTPSSVRRGRHPDSRHALQLAEERRGDVNGVVVEREQARTDPDVNRGLAAVREQGASQLVDGVGVEAVGRARQHQRFGPLAGRKQVDMADLAGAVAWMPGNTPGTEWTAWFDDLAAEFGLRIETHSPNFGIEHLLDEIAGTPGALTFAGEGVRVPWHPEIARIPAAPPVPVYPHSLLWRRDNRHPLLAALIAHLRAGYRTPTRADSWLPPAEQHLFAD
jgi:hypothetical protein